MIRRSWVVLGLLSLLSSLLAAKRADAQFEEIPPTWGGSFWDRPRATGDWGGFRDEMSKKGVVLDVDLTSMNQSVVSGGRDQELESNGLVEYSLTLDTDKAGLWPGGFFNATGMTSYGQGVDHDASALVPADMLSILPEAGRDATGLMNLAFIQFLSSSFGVIAGKLSGLGADSNAFAHDYHTQFAYSGLNLNMTLALFPLTGYGGGIIVLPWEGAVFTLSATDPDGTATNSDITKAFRNGALISSEGRFELKPFGLVGHQLVGFDWSSENYTSLEQDPSNIARLLLTKRFSRLDDPGPILTRILQRFFPGLLVPTQPLNDAKDSWAFYYNFDQLVWSPEGRTDLGIGVFGRFGVSDGIANPVKYAYNFGIAAKGVPGRPLDQFGVGWSRSDFSENLVPFLRERLSLGLSTEMGYETYYNYAITQWLSASLHMQLVESALSKQLNSAGRLEPVNNAVTIGLRLYGRF